MHQPHLLALMLLPHAAWAQDPPDAFVREIADLLEGPRVDSLLAPLSQDFVAHFVLLVPDVGAENVTILAEAAGRAFEPTAVRNDVARSMAATVSEGVVERARDALAAGPIAELRRVTAVYEPETSFAEFGADLAALDRERLQLMVSLTEARRASELEVLLDEELERVAHELVEALGADVPDFSPMSDAEFDAAYRDRTVTSALRLMYELEPAPTDLVRAVVRAYEAADWARFTESYVSGVLAAIAMAGQRVASLTVVAEEEAVPPDPASAPPCRVQVCGFQVDWDGREPSEHTPAYGAPGDLERYTLQNLSAAGYLLALGPVDDGLTIHLRARAMRALCEVMTGTDDRTCLAVGQVRVDFRGTYPGHETPGGFLLRNRCGADTYLAAAGISSLVAARIHHALTTFPGDERSVPDC